MRDGLACFKVVSITIREAQKGYQVMKIVTAFVGSSRKRNTYRAVEQYLNNLQALGNIETEIVVLSDYRLGICRGCQLCFNKGESFCPLKDDRDVLFEKIKASDGVIFATPNYTWDMSGMMKVFLDRFGFACHRPRYFGKCFTSIVVQAVGRGEKIVDTFNWTANVLGFTTLKGMTITAFDPRTEQQQKKIDRDLEKHSHRFYAMLAKPAFSPPSLSQLLMFRFARTLIHTQTNPEMLDYRYFADNHWFDSDYYYPTNLGRVKQVVGAILDHTIPALQKFFA
jgi:multimeric flavodoxin WrbA